MGITQARRLPARPAGFTLIEALIALSIFSLLIATLLWGFSQGLNAWQKGYQQEQTQQRLLQRYNWLERLLKQAVCADYRYYQGNYLPYFLGESDSFSVMTAAPLFDDPGFVKPVRLRLAKTEQGIAVYYQEGEWHSDAGRGIRWTKTETALLTQLHSAKFIFEAPAFPRPAELDERMLTPKERKRYRNQPVWLEQYDSDYLLRMPRRVSLHFVDDHDNTHTWLFSLPDASDAWGLEVYHDAF